MHKTIEMKFEGWKAYGIFTLILLGVIDVVYVTYTVTYALITKTPLPTIFH